MNRKLTIRIVAAIVIVVFVAGTWLKSRQFDLGWLKYFSGSVFLAGLVLAAWDVLLWRMPLIQRTPGVSRSVRGTWKGTLTSFWIDPATGLNPAPKIAYLSIRQTASQVLVRLMTDESSSSSSLGQVEQVDGSVILSYIYLNRPTIRVEPRSKMHHGSAVLEVSGAPARRLHGRYWTDRDSKGELEFGQRHSKIADDFLGAESLFGDSAQR